MDRGKGLIILLQRMRAGYHSGGAGHDTSGGRTISDAIGRVEKGIDRCDAADVNLLAPNKEAGSLSDSILQSEEPTRLDVSSSESSASLKEDRTADRRAGSEPA